MSKYKQCKRCGKWYEPDPSNKKKQMYCSHTCRQKANNFRERQRYHQQKEKKVLPDAWCYICKEKLPDQRPANQKVCRKRQCQKEHKRLLQKQRDLRRAPKPAPARSDTSSWTIGIHHGGRVVEAHAPARETAPELWCEGLGVGAKEWPALIMGVV